MKSRIRVRYRRIQVTLPAGYSPVLTGYCRNAACPNHNKKGLTHLHHYEYAYETKEVREAPIKALDNTVELCFTCHKLADAFRKLTANEETGQRVIGILSAIHGAKKAVRQRQLVKVPVLHGIHCAAWVEKQLAAHPDSKLFQRMKAEDDAAKAEEAARYGVPKSMAALLGALLGG